MSEHVCHRSGCGYKWNSRKEKPKKCPQCQGPLWRSPRPKKAKIPNTEAVEATPVREPVPDRGVEKPVEKFHVEQNDTLSAQKAKADELLRMLS